MNEKQGLLSHFKYRAWSAKRPLGLDRHVHDGDLQSHNKRRGLWSRHKSLRSWHGLGNSRTWCVACDLEPKHLVGATDETPDTATHQPVLNNIMNDRQHSFFKIATVAGVRCCDWCKHQHVTMPTMRRGLIANGRQHHSTSLRYTNARISTPCLTFPAVAKGFGECVNILGRPVREPITTLTSTLFWCAGNAFQRGTSHGEHEMVQVGTKKKSWHQLR